MLPPLWKRLRRASVGLIAQKKKGRTEMNDESRRAGIRRLVEAITTQEMEPFDTIYNDDVVIEWPQSGEVIRGNTTSGSFDSLFRPRPPPPCDAHSGA